MPIEHLLWHQNPSELNDPIMLTGFVRKNGYGTTAVASLQHLINAHEGQAVAEIDSEDFFDFTVTSPALERRGDERVLVWPRNVIYRLKDTGSSRDVFVLAGIEPHMHWRSFIEALHAFMTRVGVRQLLGVYSWPGAVPHTRPIPLRLTSDHAELAELLDVRASELDYVGPVDFATTFLRSADPIQAGGLSVSVPNYLGVVPNPLAMLSLIEAYDRFCGMQTNAVELRELAERVKAKADEGIAESTELADAIRQMEQQYDATLEASQPADDSGDDTLPSSSDLLRDVEAFLNRDRDAPAEPTE